MEINNQNKEHKVCCINRKKLTLSGISKVESANLTQIVVTINTDTLCILGANLHVDKLDILSGAVEITGQINDIRYTDKKQNFFKRIFK